MVIKEQKPNMEHCTGFRVGGRHQDKDVELPAAAGHRYDEVAVPLSKGIA